MGVLGESLGMICRYYYIYKYRRIPTHRGSMNADGYIWVCQLIKNTRVYMYSPVTHMYIYIPIL